MFWTCLGSVCLFLCRKCWKGCQYSTTLAICCRGLFIPRHEQTPTYLFDFTLTNRSLRMKQNFKKKKQHWCQQHWQTQKSFSSKACSLEKKIKEKIQFCCNDLCVKLVLTTVNKKRSQGLTTKTAPSLLPKVFSKRWTIIS